MIADGNGNNLNRDDIESKSVWSADGINKTGLQALENLSSEDIDFTSSRLGWQLRNFWFDPKE